MHSALGEALRGCVRAGGASSDSELLSRVAVGNPQGLVTAAVAHRVAGYLRLAVASQGEPEARRALSEAGLDTVWRTQFARHVRLSAELVTLGAALDRAEIPWVTFKGPVLAETVHARPDLRFYVDLDLLVSPSRLGDAIEVLESVGCELLVRNWPLANRVHPGELSLLTPGGTPLDLHWHVLNDRRARMATDLRTDELIRRSRRVDLLGASVPTLDPVDTVVHLCVHAAQSGADRLGQLVDVARALDLIDVDDAVRRAREQNVAPMVEVVLRRVGSVLGVPVSRRQLTLLVPAPSWRVVSRVSVGLPRIPSTGQGGSVARLVARAARTDAKSSLREALHRAFEWLTHPGSAGRDRDLWDPNRPDSLLFDAHDPAGRETFLAMVAEDAQDSSESRSRSRSAPSSGSE